MASQSTLYGQSLTLLTDLYQVTMAYGYWKTGMADREAVFHLFFREHPFGGGFTIACGLEPALKFVESFRFEESDREYLASLEGNDGKRLFDPAFLDELGSLRLECDIDAIPEGTVVFPHEPLLRVRGRLLRAHDHRRGPRPRAVRLGGAAGAHGRHRSDRHRAQPEAPEEPSWLGRRER